MTRASTDPAASMALLRDLMRDDAGAEYADAAHRRSQGPAATPEGAPEPTRRGGSVLFALCVALVAGILVLGLVQRTVDEPAAMAVRQSLVDRAAAAENRVSLLEAANAASRAELGALDDAALADTVVGEATSARISALSVASGYTSVAGGGIVVQLDDAAGIDRSDPSSPGRVLDSDVQTAVNGLWQSGAEAIAVNGRRLTATTAIRGAGSAILVDFKPLVPPYRVEAIGSPSDLLARYTATRSARALGALADDYGLRIVTSAASELTIPAATAIVPTLARVPGSAPIGGSRSTAPGTAGSP